MNAVSNHLGPYCKAIAIAVLIAVVLVLDANGVDVPIDVDSLWEALGLLVVGTGVVYVPRNKPKVRSR